MIPRLYIMIPSLQIAGTRLVNGSEAGGVWIDVDRLGQTVNNFRFSLADPSRN